MTSLIRQLIERYESTPPNETIGDNYLSRWHLVRTKGWGNLYLHRFSGDDRADALHDHPWANLSIVLRGSYREIFEDRAVIRRGGDIVFRWAKTPHRLEVVEGPVWSLFVTGPKTREWGFRTEAGFAPWYEYGRDDVSP